VHALEDPDSFVQTAAIQALGDIGHPDKTVVTFLQESKNSPEPHTKAASLVSLSRLGLATSEEEIEARNYLLSLIKKPNDFLRVEAIEAFGDFPQTDEVTDMLLSFAQEGLVGIVRDKALLSLANLGYGPAKNLFMEYIRGNVSVPNPEEEKALNLNQKTAVKALILLYQKNLSVFEPKELVDLFQEQVRMVTEPLFREFVVEHQMTEAVEVMMDLTHYHKVLYRACALRGLYLFALSMKEYYPAIHDRMSNRALYDPESKIREVAQSFLSQLKKTQENPLLTQI
jgi:hypothetical protein